MDSIQNKIITIVSKEEAKTKTGTNTQIKITDQDGIKFSFFKKRKDGNLTSPAAQFKDAGFDEGSTVEIGYVEEKYKGTDGTERTSNKIINFREASSRPVKTTSTQSTKPENTYHKEEKETDWTGIAIGKTQSLFLAAYIQSGKSFQDALLQVTQARRLAELVVAGDKKVEVIEEQVQEEPPLPEIPF
jgi:hypothetical protein